MGRPSLKAIVEDLRRGGHALVCDEPVDPDLELAEIQRRLYRSQAPAVLFTNVAGCRFPMLANLFGTIERARYVFRDTYESVRRAIELKIDPQAFFRRPTRYWKAPFTALAMQPRRVRSGPILHESVRLSELPKLRSWPLDGGPFITLPQVYTESVDEPGWRKSNLGMYRVQLSGNDYEPDREVGLHYQIHRGIGVHHQAALHAGKPFRANVFVGGHPAMTLAAVMPLPEGLSELTFAGALAGHRIPLLDGSVVDGEPGRPSIYADADFCLCGTVEADVEKPEGPFGDHLGYYSLQHPYPVLRIERVFARKDAIWPFTVVGRPPQEDTTFGQLIHELTGPVIPTVLPGVKAVHAVDAAGVHPLLLAIGSERYFPYRPSDRPAELLTQASAILGQGQMSLAKYVFIVDGGEDRALDVHDVEAFFRHLLARIDWSRDLHFQTRTTIDTLDYTGDAINEGSKLIVAARGPVRRELATDVPGDLRLPDAFSDPRLVLPGVVVVQAPPVSDDAANEEYDRDLLRFCDAFSRFERDNSIPLVVLVDDARFASASLENWLWATFTRSQPSQDVHGVGAFCERKHWGCRGPLVIDARSKPRQAPPLIEDPEVCGRVDARAAGGSMLAKWL